MTAPPTRTDHLAETLHGHEVADPYRWLEAPANDPDVRAFIEAQNAASAEHLAALPARQSFQARLRELWDHPRQGPPWRRLAQDGDGRPTGSWFQLRNDGLQDQDVLWSAPLDADDPAALPNPDAWRVLLDPNTWSEDGTASLSALSSTDDGSLLAFARSDAGSDWMTWQVVDVTTREVLPDRVPWAKFAGAAWLPDGSGFVYGAYPAPEAGHEHDAAMRDHRLLLHRLGTDAEADELVHARPDQPEWGFHPDVSHDGRWLVVTISRGTDPTTRVHVAPLTDADGAVVIGEVTPLLDANDARYVPLGVHGDELLVETDLDAPRGRVVAVPLPSTAASSSDAPPLREVVAETDDRLEAVHLVGGADPADAGWIVCRRLHHATARLVVHDLGSGDRQHVIELPGPGSVDALSGGRQDRVVHLNFATFAAPPTLLRHHLDDDRGTVEEVEAPALPEGSPDLVVDQVRVHHDGVAVPLFVIRRDDVTPDGARPTVLWGYGGFDIPVTPRYLPAWRAWVDAGGVLAVACLRGGGEYGREWHDDGRLANKQHVFDDALACAAWLTGQRRDEVHATALTEGAEPDVVWSAPANLGIEGRSNGGLLVGACLTQAPEAFGSAVPEVGVLDLVRFHRFTIGWAWTSDYGSPDDPDDLEVLLRYSPYHRLEAGRAYPATLVTTGDTDDRVVPAHSFKFAAALQAAQAGEAPVILRIDTSAGHGMGKPVSKLIEERADVLAFHAFHLGLEVDGSIAPK